MSNNRRTAAADSAAGSSRTRSRLDPALRLELGEPRGDEPDLVCGFDARQHQTAQTRAHHRVEIAFEFAAADRDRPHEHWERRARVEEFGHMAPGRLVLGRGYGILEVQR